VSYLVHDPCAGGLRSTPAPGLHGAFSGIAGSWVKFTQVIKVWIPLTLCGCGLLFTFRIGLWNIGVEGQVMIGAVFTTWMLRVGVGRPEIAPLFIAASLAASVMGGALWAGIAGFLKTKRRQRNICRAGTQFRSAGRLALADIRAMETARGGLHERDRNFFPQSCGFRPRPCSEYHRSPWAS